MLSAPSGAGPRAARLELGLLQCSKVLCWYVEELLVQGRRLRRGTVSYCFCTDIPNISMPLPPRQTLPQQRALLGWAHQNRIHLLYESTVLCTTHTCTHRVSWSDTLLVKSPGSFLFDSPFGIRASKVRGDGWRAKTPNCSGITVLP